MNLEKFIDVRQKENYHNAFNTLRNEHVDKQKYDEIIKSSIKKFSVGSKEYIIKRFHDQLARKRKKEIPYKTYLNTPQDIIAALGCIDAVRQSPHETLLNECIKRNFKKDDKTHLMEDGTLGFTSDNKSLDYKHLDKEIYIVAKHINNKGGSQVNEGSEIKRYIERLAKSSIIEEMIFILSGDYFTDKIIDGINDKISSLNLQNKTVLLVRPDSDMLTTHFTKEKYNAIQKI